MNWFRFTFVASLAALVFALNQSAHGQASPATLKPGPLLSVAEDLAGEDEHEPEGISGIACRPASNGGKDCLLINDESQGAQLVRIQDGVLTPGAVIPIVGAAPSPDTLGQPPQILTCPKKSSGDFDETDGEGVAYSAPYFYVVGSHGCSRKKGKFKLSAFILARIQVHPNGREFKTETTYRLSDILRNEPRVSQFFGKQLQTPSSAKEEANGLNIEGIAVQDDTILIGLRAPVDRETGDAFMLRTSVADLFLREAGKEHLPSSAVPELIPLRLGKNVGIRDMAFASDGRLFVLGGPAQAQIADSWLFLVDPANGKVLTSWRLPRLTGPSAGGKAEGLAVLEPGRVLIMFDQIMNGGAREYTFD